MTVCAALYGITPLSAQNVQDINSLSGMSVQQQNAALLRMHDQQEVRSASGAAGQVQTPQRLLPSQYAEMKFRAKADFPELDIVKDILTQPEDAIDLAQVEVAVERLIDPSISEMSTLHQLDVLAAAVKARFPQGDVTDTELKGLILLSTLRDAGPWNGNRPFSYDFDNPLGKDIKDKLLSNFLASRQGNCVSMPVLFVVLGQKLGLPVTLSRAPQHDFAKFRKDDGTWTNIEVTSYGGMSDQHYIEQMVITPQALANHIWLQTLTKKQSAVVILNTLVQYYHDTDQPEKQLALTGLFLKVMPHFPEILIYRGDAFSQLSDQRYQKYGSHKKSIPDAMRKDWGHWKTMASLTLQKRMS